MGRNAVNKIIAAQIFGLFLFFVAQVSPPPAPWTASVTVQALYTDGTPFDGRVILVDVTAGVAVKSWQLFSTGGIFDTVSLDTSKLYRVDLVDASGIVRESVTLVPKLLPAVTYANFRLTLTHDLQADGKTYNVKRLQADLQF